MLKSLYPQVDWSKVEVIGFDLDGTLYKERDFISQVYKLLAQNIEQYSVLKCESILDFMLSRWDEKGSSFPFIFSEAISFAGVSDSLKTKLELDCLSIYRAFDPCLELSPFVTQVIEYCYLNYNLFMVTDGNCTLQNNKILSLNLCRWFDMKNIGITGCYGLDFYKPCLRILDHIPMLRGQAEFNQKIVYFGDREIDYLFAKSAGFQFVKVKEMRAI